jgi:hypothetical protein
MSGDHAENRKGLTMNLSTMTQALWNQMTVAQRDAMRSDAGLTKQLIGYEGKRVEVVDRDGTVRRFWVGRSSGWIPCHIELKRRTSTGGQSVYGAPYRSIRIVERNR